MIKECNFKYSEQYLANPNLMCGISKLICCGEDDCIFFQIYKHNTVPVTTKRGVHEYTCIECGVSGDFSFSSRYCDSCYMNICHPTLKIKEKK